MVEISEALLYGISNNLWWFWDVKPYISIKSIVVASQLATARAGGTSASVAVEPIVQCLTALSFLEIRKICFAPFLLEDGKAFSLFG